MTRYLRRGGDSPPYFFTDLSQDSLVGGCLTQSNAEASGVSNAVPESNASVLEIRMEKHYIPRWHIGAWWCLTPQNMEVTI